MSRKRKFWGQTPKLLRNTLPEFLAGAARESILAKFIRERIDLSRSEGATLAS